MKSPKEATQYPAPIISVFFVNQAHPEIDTIFCLELIGGVAAANAVEELGMQSPCGG